VLENQMIQLQERFEEQGIKVTSIEVSVGTHSFEENLEQQGQNEEQQAQNAPRRVRRLQLGPDFGAEDIEELEGDDRIAAEMMAANGGTMDVQA
jgi:flagellar hook-length control protein FliK